DEPDPLLDQAATCSNLYDDGQSEAEREFVNKWFQNTLYSRLNDKKNDVIIIVMQRTNMNDLAGFVQDLDNWEILNLPAIATKKEMIKTGPNDEDWHHRKLGEALHPEREDIETLRKIERAVGSYAFSSQYQQQPVPISGNILRREWLTWIARMPSPTAFDAIYQSWDTAAGTNASNSFSVCTTWGVRSDGRYLIDLLRDRMTFPDLVKAVKEKAAEYHPRVILIENASSGQALIQTLENAPGLPIKSIKPDMDKVTRLEQVSVEFEAKRVFFPKEAYWRAELEQEFLTFPDSQFDDQVDSSTQFLRWHLDPKGGGHKKVIARTTQIRIADGIISSPAEKRRKPHPMRDPKRKLPRRF
ncbi:phage terminase large subunit, partial [bacterium]|nr:phage terminase large subunit [bacterium]